MIGFITIVINIQKSLSYSSRKNKNHLKNGKNP
jgi:hypothetical protein